MEHFLKLLGLPIAGLPNHIKEVYPKNRRYIFPSQKGARKRVKKMVKEVAHLVKQQANRRKRAQKSQRRVQAIVVVQAL